MKNLILLIILLSTLNLKAQQDMEHLRFQEDSLRICLDSLRKSPKDALRKVWNKRFKDMLSETLEMRGAFDYPFDSLKSIARLTSPDKKFRIFNWNIENDNGTFSYYGFVLVPDNKTRVFELNDQSRNIQDPEDKTLDHKKWFGALYYDIILSGSSGRTEYTLLGWDGYSPMSARKVIEVMVIQSDKLQFGAPIFTDENKKVKKRVVIEFSAKASLTLRYVEKDQMIYFDHLIPESPTAEGIREFYFPDGSYDAYQLVNEKWVIKLDVDARRGKDKRDKWWNDPKKN